VSTHEIETEIEIHIKMGVKSVLESSYVIGTKKGIMNQPLSLTFRGTFVRPFCSIQKTTEHPPCWLGFKCVLEP
jgi:hypothetical protein